MAMPEDLLPEQSPEQSEDGENQPEPATVEATPTSPAADSEGEQAEAEPASDAPPKNWYIIHSYSGFENKVAESLRTRAEAFGFNHKVGQILIPTEEVVELRNGKKVTSKRMVYPGYVLVQLDLDDEMWHAVKNTPRVTGFVGGATHPVPLSADE